MNTFPPDVCLVGRKKNVKNKRHEYNTFRTRKIKSADGNCSTQCEFITQFNQTNIHYRSSRAKLSKLSPRTSLIPVGAKEYRNVLNGKKILP